MLRLTPQQIRHLSANADINFALIAYEITNESAFTSEEFAFLTWLLQLKARITLLEISRFPCKTSTPFRLMESLIQKGVLKKEDDFVEFIAIDIEHGAKIHPTQNRQFNITTLVFALEKRISELERENAQLKFTTMKLLEQIAPSELRAAFQTAPEYDPAIVIDFTKPLSSVNPAEIFRKPATPAKRSLSSSSTQTLDTNNMHGKARAVKKTKTSTTSLFSTPQQAAPAPAPAATQRSELPTIDWSYLKKENIRKPGRK